MISYVMLEYNLAWPLKRKTALWLKRQNGKRETSQNERSAKTAKRRNGKRPKRMGQRC